MDERGQVQKYTPRGASKGNVGKVDDIATRVQRVGNRVFTDRMISGAAVGSEYRQTEYYTLAPHAIVHCGATGVSRSSLVTNQRGALTTNSLTVMTWLSQKVAWFSWNQSAKRRLRMTQCPGRRSSSTLQPRPHCSGRSWACPLPGPSLQPVPCWQSLGTPRSFSLLFTLGMSKRSEWSTDT